MNYSEKYSEYESSYADKVTQLPILGKTITRIEGLEKDNDEVYFYCSDDTFYRMYHYQECCESVVIDDINGDINCLIGSQLLKAEEFTRIPEKDEYGSSTTFTFYNFATIKGYVQIKWFSESNGYYSEEVSFEEAHYRLNDNDKKLCDACRSDIENISRNLNKGVYSNEFSSDSYKEDLKRIRSKLYYISNSLSDMIDSKIKNLGSNYRCPKCKEPISSIVVKDVYLLDKDNVIANKDKIIEQIGGHMGPMEYEALLLMIETRNRIYSSLDPIIIQVHDNLISYNQEVYSRSRRLTPYTSILFNKDMFPIDDYKELKKEKQIGYFCEHCGEDLSGFDFRLSIK